jgi:hypothetical protein
VRLSPAPSPRSVPSAGRDPPQVEVGRECPGPGCDLSRALCDEERRFRRQQGQCSRELAGFATLLAGGGATVHSMTLTTPSIVSTGAPFRSRKRCFMPISSETIVRIDCSSRSSSLACSNISSGTTISARAGRETTIDEWHSGHPMTGSTVDDTANTAA